VLELTPGQLFAGDFRVVRPLNKGGMGSVYVVEQLSTQQQRALKLMHPELVRDPRLRQRFEQEARIGGQIPSDHIAQVISAGVDPASGTPWLAMELLQGETLAEWCVRRRTSLSELFEIYGQLCHGVGAAHARGIVHRDLKPENIFVAVPRQAGLAFFIKVLDFGIAKMSSQHASGSATTSMGTPLWMAPEQTENGRIGPPADVWALGLIAFTLLTQRVYWTNGNRDETTLPVLMREILFEPLVPASMRAWQLGVALEGGAAFDAWFARCVNRDPAQRFPTANEAYAALVNLRSNVPLAAAASPAATVAYDGPPPFGVPYAGAPAGTGGGVPAGATEHRGPPQGVTERGVSETMRQAPRGSGRVVGIAAAAVIAAGGIGATAWMALHRSAVAAACAADEVLGSDGTCACPAGSSKVAGHCAAAPLAACPVGQVRKDASSACLCADGNTPNALGQCPASVCAAVPDQPAIRAALKQAETKAREACHAPNAAENSGTVTITVAPNGHVTDARIEGPLAGSEGARCLSDMFTKTTVACFTGEPLKLKKNIQLP
jgi:tRNA A-37 threonylcarbamoyl transferase component Bud32